VNLKGQTAKGEAWSARFVDPSDIPFYQALFNDKAVMANFGEQALKLLALLVQKCKC
jgi:hypothetical protein